MNKTYQKEQTAPRAAAGNPRRRILIAAAAALLLTLAVLFLTLKYRAAETKGTADNFYDPSAVTGILPGMTKSEIQAELNRVVEEGMLNISISTVIHFTDGSTEGKADIVNVEANHYDFSVSITLDDSGETLYESGGIKPGQYIQYIKLSKALADGDHNATATFTAYTGEHQLVGTAAAKITLKVGTVSS